MRPRTVKALDRWLGRPLCGAMTLLRRVGEWASPPSGGGQARPPQKVLFIKLIELGANVLAWPAYRLAIERVGRENVFIWCFRENRPILEAMEVVPPGNVLSVRSGRLREFTADVLRTLWRIRGLGIDAVVDLEFFSRASAILAYLTGARLRIGLHPFTAEGVYRGDLFTHRVQYNPYTHVSMYYYLLVDALWRSPSERPIPKRPLPDAALHPPRFSPTQEDQRRIRTMLEEAAGRPVAPPIVLLNPNTGDLVPLRRWPTERVIELGRRILESHPDVTIVITGSPSEQQAAEQVCSAIRHATFDVRRSGSRVLSVAGRTTLRDLLALYDLSDVLVTNDSGPGQFASMTQVEAVVLFGPETPLLWGPLGGRAHVIWQALACSPCVNPFNYRFSPCRDPRCMLNITVQTVQDVVLCILKRRGDSASRT